MIYSIGAKGVTGPGSSAPGITDFNEPVQNVRDLYKSALQRFAERRAQARTDFLGAETPLQERVGMFQPGGGYGAGQRAIIEQQAKEALGAGQTSLVQTGMASGSTMAGLHGLVSAKAGEMELGVEDVRIENLSRALEALSNLRGAAAGTLLAAQEPGFEPVASLEASRLGSLTSQKVATIQGEYGMKQSQLAADTARTSQFGNIAAAYFKNRPSPSYGPTSSPMLPYRATDQDYIQAGIRPPGSAATVNTV